MCSHYRSKCLTCEEDVKCNCETTDETITVPCDFTRSFLNFYNSSGNVKNPENIWFELNWHVYFICSGSDVCPKSKLGAAVFLERKNCDGERFCSNKNNKLNFCNCYKTKNDMDDVTRCPQKNHNSNKTLLLVAGLNSGVVEAHCTNFFMSMDKDILIWILIGLVAVLFCIVLLTMLIVLRIKLLTGVSSLLVETVGQPEKISNEKCGCFELNKNGVGVFVGQQSEKIMEDDQYLSIIHSHPNFMY